MSELELERWLRTVANREWDRMHCLALVMEQRRGKP